jgi:hypothetical protein
MFLDQILLGGYVHMIYPCPMGVSGNWEYISCGMGKWNITIDSASDMALALAYISSPIGLLIVAASHRNRDMGILTWPYGIITLDIGLKVYADSKSRAIGLMVRVYTESLDIGLKLHALLNI